MKTLPVGYCLLLTGCLCLNAQVDGYSNRFRIEPQRLSAFGESPLFSLNPGHEVRLTGRIGGRATELVLVPQNTVVDFPLQLGGRTQNVPCRFVEERWLQNGTVTESSRYLLSRDTVTGDVFLLGKDQAVVEGATVADFKTLWRAGTGQAEAGLWMPGQFLNGSRYVQGTGEDDYVRLAENVADAGTMETAIGTLENVASVRISQVAGDSQADWQESFAPGVGLVARDANLSLSKLSLATHGLPKGATFVPYSNHRYFPLVPGAKSRIEGVEDFLETSVETEVLDQVQPITVSIEGEDTVINARVIEDREYVNGNLFELGRSYYAQCVETGDVFILGEDVQIFLENGAVVIEGDSWMAGVDGAEAGIAMPGNLTVGATYLQEFVPEFSLNEVQIESLSDSVTVPIGSFTDCLRVVENSLLIPDELPSVKTYAPGIGLVDDEGILKLTTLSGLEDPNAPRITIESVIRLSWPVGSTDVRLESSVDAVQWEGVPAALRFDNVRAETILPGVDQHRFFRLVED